MSTLAVADLSTARVSPARSGHAVRPRAGRLRPVADAAGSSVTVTITVGTPGSEQGERVLAALRALVLAAGPGATIDLGEAEVPPAPAETGGLWLDPRPRSVTLDGRELDLSRLEYELLLFLARHPRQVFSRSQLLGHVWGHTQTTSRTVDVHMSRLRAKLGDPDIVTTVYGVGYRLSDTARITVGNR